MTFAADQQKDKGFWFGPGTVARSDTRPLGLRPSTRDDFAQRFSKAVGAAIADGTMSARSGHVESFYRDPNYQKGLAVAAKATNSNHSRWFAVDQSLSTINQGRMPDWLRHLADQGLYSPLAWDSNHIEPMPGTSLFDARGDAGSPDYLGFRLSYSGQVDRLIAMREKIATNPDLYPSLAGLLEHFPTQSARSEQEALDVVGKFRAETYQALKDDGVRQVMKMLEEASTENLPKIIPGRSANLVQQFAPMEPDLFSLPEQWAAPPLHHPHESSTDQLWAAAQRAYNAFVKAHDEDEPHEPEEPSGGDDGGSDGGSSAWEGDDSGPPSKPDWEYPDCQFVKKANVPC